MNKNKDIIVRNSLRPVFLSPYIPRECGIATYTRNLLHSIHNINPDKIADIVIIDDSLGKMDYTKKAKFIINYKNKNDYLKAATIINRSRNNLVHIQHEFGVFGGDDGEYVLDFIKYLKKPYVITFHTVLSAPTQNQKRITAILSRQAKAVIVMAREAIKRLENIYHVDVNKIIVIPHGVPDISFGDGEKIKNYLGYKGKKIISTFGLLSKNKGIEYAIMAMKEITKQFPDVLFLIIGKTHPAILKNDGEVYRNFLKKLVKNNKISKNVKFVNNYLTFDEIIYYLKATDIYITPYLEKDQITSGTLAYAVGAGKVCLSTPYAYAKEILCGGRGYFVPFRNSVEIEKKILLLFKNEKKYLDMSLKSYRYGRKMIWESVGLEHLKLFNEVVG